MAITCYYQHFVAVNRKYNWTIDVITDNTESVLGIRPHSKHLTEKDRHKVIQEKPVFDHITQDNCHLEIKCTFRGVKNSSPVSRLVCTSYFPRPGNTLDL